MSTVGENQLQRIIRDLHGKISLSLPHTLSVIYCTCTQSCELSVLTLIGQEMLKLILETDTTLFPHLLRILIGIHQA